MPVVLVEAEKSALALVAWAERNQHKLLPVAMGGCYGWRGRIGKQDGADGKQADETGALPDLAICRNRDVVAMLDSNADAKSAVRTARFALVRELNHMGARVRIATVPPLDGVNGPDDLIAVAGDEAISSVLELAQLSPEAIAAEVEAAIGKILAAKPNIGAEHMRRALDAVADVSDNIERAMLEGRIAASVVKSFADVAAGRQDDSWLTLWHSRDCLCYRSSLFLAHATLQHKQVVHFASKSRLEVFQVINSASKKQWGTPVCG